MIKSLRGMNSLQGIEGKKYIDFINIASNIAINYGFEFIKTPLLEDVSLFTRAVGSSSDIVYKEMYDFIDKSNKHISLRPEATACIVREFIEKKQDKTKKIFRYFYHGSMFRYERPQKGRLREFTQFGCESFGVKSPFEDALMIMMIKDIFDYFKIDFKIDINSIGCPKCLSAFKKETKKRLLSEKDDFCKDCNRRMVQNPLRVFDCKNSNCVSKLSNFKTITDNLCYECKDDFDLLNKILKNSNIDFQINKKLVRGLDYYTKTIFEFVSCEVGSQNALCGGGRYDTLILSMGGQDTPSVGFAIGIERILPLINQTEKEPKHIYIGALSEEFIQDIFLLFLKLNKYLKVFIEYKKRSFTKHLSNGQKLNSDYVIIKQNQEGFFIKNMKTDKIEQLTLNEITKKFCNSLI